MVPFNLVPRYRADGPGDEVVVPLPGALSFCMEKPVVPVVNQMERTFSKKKEYLLRYSSFLVFTGMIEKSCSICGVSLVPCSLVN